MLLAAASAGTLAEPLEPPHLLHLHLQVRLLAEPLHLLHATLLLAEPLHLRLFPLYLLLLAEPLHLRLRHLHLRRLHLLLLVAEPLQELQAATWPCAAGPPTWRTRSTPSSVSDLVLPLRRPSSTLNSVNDLLLLLLSRISVNDLLVILLVSPPRRP